MLRTCGIHLSRFDEYPYNIRENIKAHIQANAAHITGEVLDIGSSPWNYPKEQFSGKANITTLDIRPPADVLGDIMDAPFADDTFDTVLCLEVLEHVRNPFIALAEMYRILKPGGYLIASTPFFYELHDEDYGDHWRFTRQGWGVLLEKFTEVAIAPFGKYPNRMPNSYTVVARKPRKDVPA
jgi:SAM-dependent methyltransferase